MDQATHQEPLAITILSGFLGSGKTTLLNHLLRAPHGRKLAVIVNEFGAVGIDGALVPQGEQFVEMDNGCLCCALNEDLVATLQSLCDRGGIDHIVIETTGLADPLPIAWSCTRPGLSQAVRVDAIVTVVDAAAIERALAESKEARLQLLRADIVLINKCDLVDDGGALAQTRVQEINALAPRLLTTQAAVPWWLLLGRDGAGTGAHRYDDDGLTGIPSHAPHGQAQDRYQTVSLGLTGDRPLDEAALESMCYQIPEQVFRYKGLLRVDCQEGPWLLINGVAGRFDLRFMQPQRTPDVSAMVFIGRNLDVAPLKELCAQAMGVAPHDLLEVH